MDAARWSEIEQVLDLMLDRDPAEWPALLADACAGDAALRSSVEALLAAHAQAPPLLEAGAGPLAAALVEAMDHEDPLVGQRLGVWRLIRELGRGGMSRVYLGEREESTFAQRAAVKVLRAGLDRPSDVQRFQAERQILASLEHPYIARLLDGGVTPDGRPFLVLEYVDGMPLTEWCRAGALELRARVRLLLSVAEAIEAAHKRLVVHRDLKPSNILVDTDGRPRLLDFGIARMLEADGAGDVTVTRQRWLSPAYAAPEQFEGANITTATDVYQLGAVLYEVLSGQRPFDPASDAVRSRDPASEPPPPSRWNPSLVGDLDAIIRKAMRIDPESRYASVAELAMELRRWLDGDPVQARIGDRGYRWRRVLRRRAVPLSVGLAALLLGVAWTATLAVQNRRITAALEDATRERARAEQVTQFVVSLFEANDPRGERSDTVTARTLLTRGERQAVRLAGEPVAQAELLDVIGRIRMMLGAYADARPSLERAYALTRQLHGDGHPASIRRQLGLALLAEREGRLDDADRDNRAALEHAIRIGSDSSVLALDALFQLASVQHLRGRYASSDSIFLRWSAGVERAARPADSTLARQLHVYGEYLGARQQLQRTPGDAVAVFRRALEARRAVLGAGHTDVAVTQQRLAIALSREGQMAEADSLMANALPILERAYPEGHRELVDAHHNYGAMLQSAGRHAEALRHFETAAAMMTRLVGAEHPLGAAYHLGWGSALLVAGEYAEAVRILGEAGDRFRGQGATGALMASVADLGRSESLLAIGRRRDAERLALETYRSIAAAQGERHRLARRAMRVLVAMYEADAQTDEAARWRVRLAAADSAAAVR